MGHCTAGCLPAPSAENEPLEAYLTNQVFAGENGTTMAPTQGISRALLPSWNATKGG